MKRQLLLRADDLGYSKGVNYGIYECVKYGLVKSVGVMINMEQTQHGLNLLKDYDIALGLHVNLSSGKPISSPEDVSSLITPDGTFHASSYYKRENVSNINIQEIDLEVTAQINRFVERVGSTPDYIDIHAVSRLEISDCVSALADELHLKYSGIPRNYKDSIQIGSTMIRYLITPDPNLSVFQMLEQEFVNPTPLPMIAVCHPGFIDKTLLETSSLTKQRVYEMDLLCSNTLKKTLSPFDLISYREL